MSQLAWLVGIFVNLTDKPQGLQKVHNKGHCVHILACMHTIFQHDVVLIPANRDQSRVLGTMEPLRHTTHNGFIYICAHVHNAGIYVH